MKKSLLALAGGLLMSVVSADAATVYFEKTEATQSWAKVYSYAWNPQDTNGSFPECTEVEIDGHTLYSRELTTQTQIIFLDAPGWSGKTGQTSDLPVVEGAVYDFDCNKDSGPIAYIKNGKYETNSEFEDPTENIVLYLRGSFDQYWSCLDEYKFTKQDDGTYTLTTTLTAGALFKVGCDGWKPVDLGGDFTIVPGGTYTLVQGTDSNLTAGVGLTDVTFTVNLETSELKVSDGSGEDPDVKWWCAWDLGDGEGWQFGNELVKEDDGTFMVVVTTPADSDENYFAVFQGINNTDFNSGIRYTPIGQKTITVDEDGVYDMQTGSDGAWQLMLNGTWTVVVDPRVQAKSTISFDWGNSTGEANVLIDRVSEGEHSYKAYALTPVEDQDRVYTYTGKLNKGDKLKFNILDTFYYYDPSIGTIQGDDADFDDVLTIKYPLAEGSGEVTFDYPSEVVITVNVPENEISIDFKDAPRVSMTITNGESSTIHRVTRQGDTRIYVTHTIECQPGDQIDFRLLNTRYECDFTNPTSTEGTTKVYALVEASDEEAAPALGLTEAKNLIFTVDAANKTLTVAESEEDPTPDPDPDPEFNYDFYIKGDIFTGDTNWTDKKMTLTDGKFVLADQTIYSGSFGIMVIDPSIELGGEVTTQQVLWLAALGESFKEVEIGETCYLSSENAVNFHIYGGTYTFTFDPDAMTMVVTGTQTVFPTEGFEGWTVTLAGSMNGWQNSTDTVDVDDDGKAVLKSEDIDAGASFKFILKKGETGSTWYSIANTFELNKALELADGGDITIPGASKAKEYTFNFDFSAEPYTVTVTEGVATGISEIALDAEDTVFFNLQGVKVEKPENGLYIVVHNGKSQKVMVK